MFFSISQQIDRRYPAQWSLGNFCVGTDAGWTRAVVGDYEVIYKGYADNDVMESYLSTIVIDGAPPITGNFCVLRYDGSTNTIDIRTDIWRSFPIYVHDHCVTNLVKNDSVAWTNIGVVVRDPWHVTLHRRHHHIAKNNDVATVDDIDDVLRTKISSFARQLHKPVKVFLSGGVDTLLVYSYLCNLKIPHEIVWCHHIDHDAFWLANHDDIQQHWGYRQIHHWADPCVLASGAPGDEFMLRSPATANLFLLNHGTNIPALLGQHADCLHRDYFMLEKNQCTFHDQARDFKPSKVMQFDLANTVLNDYQHWHIGHTLTWTPLRDLDMFMNFLHLPFELAVAQIMDSAVSKILIERNVPGLTAVISDQKNSKNYLANLRVLMPG